MTTVIVGCIVNRQNPPMWAQGHASNLGDAERYLCTTDGLFWLPFGKDKREGIIGYIIPTIEDVNRDELRVLDSYVLAANERLVRAMWDQHFPNVKLSVLLVQTP